MFPTLNRFLSRVESELLKANQFPSENQQQFQASLKENQNSSPPKCFVGFRTWSLNQASQLTGISYAEIWPSRIVATSHCHADKLHHAPHKTCQCGWWAKWNFHTTYQYQIPMGIRGAILGWGKVERHHDEGFRCEHAQIIALEKPTNALVVNDNLSYRINDNVKIAQKIAEQYDVPLLSAKELVEFSLPQGLTFEQLEDK